MPHMCCTCLKSYTSGTGMPHIYILYMGFIYSILEAVSTIELNSGSIFFSSHLYKEMKWCMPQDKVGFIFSCVFLYSFLDWYDHLCNVFDIISSLQIWLFSKIKAPLSQYSITRSFLTALNRHLCENISTKYIKKFQTNGSNTLFSMCTGMKLTVLLKRHRKCPLYHLNKGAHVTQMCMLLQCDFCLLSENMRQLDKHFIVSLIFCQMCKKRRAQ